MSIAENAKKIEAAIFSAFFDNFENGYAVEITDLTDDYFEEGEDALAFGVETRRSLLTWYDKTLSFLLLLENGTLSLRIDFQEYCEDVAEIAEAIPHYLASNANTLWQLHSIYEDLPDENGAPPSVTYEDYAYNTYFKAEVPLDDLDCFGQTLVSLLTTLEEDTYAKNLAEVFTCFRAESSLDSWERLTFCWNGNPPEIVVSDKDERDGCIRIPRNGHPSLYINNIKCNIPLYALATVEITHPTLFKKGHIAFLNKENSPLQLSSREFLAPPASFFIAPKCKQDCLLLEGLLQRELSPHGIEIIRMTY